MYNNKSDYSGNNNDSRYTSTVEDDGRDIVNFISNSNDDNNFNDHDSNSTDNTVTKDTADCYTSEVNDLGAPV